MKKVFAILFFLLAAGVVIFFAVSPSIQKQQAEAKINSFEQCAAAGYPIQDTYPRQCALPSGKFFVEQMVPEK